MSGDAAARERKLDGIRKMSAKIKAASEVSAIPMDVETFPIEEDTKDFRESVTECCVSRLCPGIDAEKLKHLVALYMRPVGKVPVDAGLPAHPIHEVLGWYNFVEKGKTLIAPYFAFKLVSTGEVFLRPMLAANRAWAFKTARDDRTPHSEAEAQYIEAARIAGERDSGVTLDIYREFRELVCEVQRDGATVKVPVCDSNTLTRFATERSSSKRRDGEPIHDDVFAVPPSDGAIDVASAANLDALVANDIDAGGASPANIALVYSGALVTMFKNVCKIPDAPRPASAPSNKRPPTAKAKPAEKRAAVAEATPVEPAKPARVVKAAPAPSFAKKFEAPAAPPVKSAAPPTQPKPKEAKTNGEKPKTNGEKARSHGEKARSNGVAKVATTAPLGTHTKSNAPAPSTQAGAMMLRTGGLIVDIAQASLQKTTVETLAAQTHTQELLTADGAPALFAKLDELYEAKADVMLAMLMYFIVPVEGATYVYPTGRTRMLFDIVAGAMTGIPHTRVLEARKHKLDSFTTREMLKAFLLECGLSGDLLMLVHMFYKATETTAGKTDAFNDLI